MEDISGRVAKIFSGFDERIAWWLEESEDGESEIRQCSEYIAESGATVVAIFIPPAVFDEVQRILDLPVVADEFLKVARLHIRQVDARDTNAKYGVNPDAKLFGTVKK